LSEKWAFAKKVWETPPQAKGKQLILQLPAVVNAGMIVYPIHIREVVTMGVRRARKTGSCPRPWKL